MPELHALKMLRIPIGTVVLFEVDLTAVGVAVAAHPDVEFLLVACGEPATAAELNTSRPQELAQLLTDRKRCGDITQISGATIAALTKDVGGFDIATSTCVCARWDR